MAEQNNITFDIDESFSKVIETGVVEKEIKLTDDMTIKMKPLGAGETLVAEASEYSHGLPSDVISRMRIIAILAKATVSVNGKPIKVDSLSDEDNYRRYVSLKANYKKLPEHLVSKLEKFYFSLLREQGNIYDKVEEKIENF